MFRERRRPPAVRQEASVAAAASSALRGEEPVAFVDEVGQHEARFVVAHDRALGDRDQGVGTAGPVATLALAVNAVAGAAMRVVSKPEQRCDIAVGDEPDVAAAAAVAAVRPTLGHVGFAAERDAARAAVTAFDVDVRLVDEAGHPLRLGGPTRILGKALRSDLLAGC